MCKVDAIIVIFQNNIPVEGFALKKLNDLKDRLNGCGVSFIKKESDGYIQVIVNNKNFKKLCRLGFKECREAVTIKTGREKK